MKKHITIILIFTFAIAWGFYDSPQPDISFDEISTKWLAEREARKDFTIKFSSSTDTYVMEYQK